MSLLDRGTEVLLYAMVVFSPWAFGTTQLWSMRSMNAAGYALGGMLLVKVVLRESSRQRVSPAVREKKSVAGAVFTNHLTMALLVITLSILGYILLSALNAQFTYIPAEWRQEPRPHLEWLPHSLDRNATWCLFWNWLALACVFWAMHDWLLGEVTSDGRRSAKRLRRLIFVVAANAALVAFEGILQRNSGTPKLLWFKTTHDNPIASAQFGPYAYRSNAAQLFNLLWPVTLGLWWQSHLQRERRSQWNHWLLPCVMLLVAAPLISMSRGGVAVTLLQTCACGFILFARGKFDTAARWGILLFFIVTIAATFYLGWDELAQRLREGAADPLSGRSETYRLAARMTQDYPLFGVGPGAFESVFQFYRTSPNDYWPAQLHNDWLEYLITFGWTGCALLGAAVVLIAVRWFESGGLQSQWTFAAFIWIGIAGCLLHARFDFPLQIYSVQFVFALLGAMLFSLSRPESSRS